MSATFQATIHAQILSWLEQVLTAVNPTILTQKQLARNGRQLIIGPITHRLDDGRLFLISLGKAALPMAQAAAAVLGDAISAAIVISKQLPPAYRLPLTDYHIFVGDHPVAGERSLRATTAVTDLISQTQPGDLVLCLISGGTSALLSQPLVPLADWQVLNQALLASGCTIQEFNTVRRQLDAIKGGGLARLAAPAQVISLILSDVIGNDLAAIGSGPTVLVAETPQEALVVLRNYELGIRNYEGGTAAYQHIHTALTQLPITQLPNYQLPPPRNTIIGNVALAATTARQSAENSGFTATTLTTHLEGEAREAGKFAAAIAKELPPGHCAILGGETTVTVRGNGVGGRNLELALAAAIALDGWESIAIATFATDGEDGPTGVAGAVVTGETVGYGRSLHLIARQYLNNNDSYTYFQTLDIAGYTPHLLITGPTSTNVNDLIFIIHHS
jgi:hydroxypyruvate reductase